MEHFATALAVRFGLTELSPERHDQVQSLVRQHVTTYHPATVSSAQLSHVLTELFLLPSTVGGLITTTLYPNLVLAVERVVVEHWMLLALELGFEHPASRYTTVIYHGGCPDGLASAWCFWRHNRHLEMIPMTHGQEPPNVAGKRVVVLDFSFKRPILEKLHAEAELFEVKDHHKSAKLDLEGLDYCDFDMSRAGCEMAWDFVEGVAPKSFFLKAIADHDIWKKIPNSEAICKALHKREFISLEAFDQLFANPHLEADLLVEGRLLIQADQSRIKKALGYSRLYKFKGPGATIEHTVRVGVSPSGLRSEFGHEMCLTGDCDFSMSWTYVLEKDEWWCSLRSSDDLADVSAIASMFKGGGGHRNASGITIYGTDGENLRTYFTPLD
jgi:hypothetical protein